MRSRADYLRVQRVGRRRRGRLFILLWVGNGLSFSRFGLTVSRKTGNAVTRNRIKRRIREIQRCNRHRIAPGHDLVVIAAAGTDRAEMKDLERDYLDLVQRAGLLVEVPKQ